MTQNCSLTRARDPKFCAGTSSCSGNPAASPESSIGKLDASARIVENRDYYNLAEMFAQLGIQPAAPPRPV